MTKNSPIGIFDSGLGGLTVAKQIIKLLPHEDIIYLGDTARVPYGPRSPEIIKKFSEENTKFLVDKNVKCIVIACNTSSAVAADYLKKKFKNVPIFEVINPAAKEAAKTGVKIGIIGTRATIGSKAYEKDIKKYSKTTKIISLVCPMLVPFIEEGETKSAGLKVVAREYLSKFKIDKIDTLVMGCTHYPIIEKIIVGVVGNKVKIVDPGKSVAKEISNFLTFKKMLNNQRKLGKKKFFVTDLTTRFVSVAEMFLGQKILGSIQKINLLPDKKIDMNTSNPKYVLVKKGENFKHVHKVLPHTPYFVKPFDPCGSIGESLVKKKKYLGKALKLAHKYSHLAIVGEYINAKGTLSQS